MMKTIAHTDEAGKCSRKLVEPGASFGKWTVLEENPRTRNGSVLCRCACGSEKRVQVGNLLRGMSNSCGSCNTFSPGMKQGMLYVIGYPWLDSKGRKRVKCRCECGRVYHPRTDDLLHGKIQSCQCFHFTPEYRSRMREKAFSIQQDCSGGED